MRSHIDRRGERVWTRTLALKGGRMWDFTLVGKGNETFFIRVWKPLPSGRVWKPWGEAQREQYLLAVGLGCYSWYQSQTLGGVPVRTVSPEGGRLWGPTSIGAGNKCQRGCWAPMGGGLWDPTSVGERERVLARMLGPDERWIVRSHISWKKGTSTNEDVRPLREVDCEIHISWRKGMSTNEDVRPLWEVDCEIPHQLEKGNEYQRGCSARTRGGLWDPHQLEKGNEY